MNLLIEKKEEGGMDFNHLKESNAKLGDIVEELADEGQILVIRNKEGNPRVLFHNDMQYNTPIDAGSDSDAHARSLQWGLIDC